jgi:hypothetical protein
MLIGIDTFDDRLDLTDWSAFQLWNGGRIGIDPTKPTVIGGEPAFAGRNFLGGKFIWGHAEATNAMKSPSPWNLANIKILFSRIAPIQAPNALRQSMVGERGFLFGAIDGQAICARLASSIRAGEFTLGNADTISVWLAVDRDAELSVWYWNGWADAVNSHVYARPAPFAGQRPFRAAIMCRYNRVGGRFKRDPQIDATLQAPVFRFGLNTTCHDFWADAPDPDEHGVRPGPRLDFGLFDAAEMPSVWRFSTSFRDADDDPADVTYSLDVVREPVLPEVFQPATVFMLHTAKWQPSALNIRNMGFSISNGLSAGMIACVGATPIPEMQDFADEARPAAAAADGHSKLPSQSARVVGRYLRLPAGASIANDEAQRLSDANISTFVVWERGVDGPTKTAYFDHPGRGTEDATLAFNHCGGVLRLPPHTIIFFAVDYDAGDPNPTQAKIDAGEAGGPHAEALVSTYFTEIAAQRDAYVQTHPDRPFEIGVYAPGKVLEWGYSRGLVSGFWQSVSSGAAGNAYGTRPWGHASRWQYQATSKDHSLPAPWPCIDGIDPDVDWGDGGQWNLNDRPALTLTELEFREGAAIIRNFLHNAFPGLMP